MNKVAIAVENSQNGKLGGMSTTYASIHTCPQACPFKHNKACYGNCGPSAMAWKRINSIEMTPDAIAEIEAKAIDTLSGKSTLRIHTLGDCPTNAAAQKVSNAAERYMAKHGQQAFTYTHAWREVDRSSWGKVSILASCETMEECKQAMARGYAAALVVAKFESKTAYKKDGLKLVPCPKQTGKVESCKKCSLCLRDTNLLKTNAVVALEVHGPSLRAKQTLAEKN